MPHAQVHARFFRNSGGSKRAAGNQSRLTESNLEIAREVDRVADELGRDVGTSGHRLVRQRGERMIPIVGIRKLDHLQDVLGTLEVELSAEPLSRLDEVSEIELGFPYNLLMGPQGQMVYGDLEPLIELPRAAPYRWE
ncbi:MAG TPA: aldo/keto reductase [Actinomycetota bacterium]|nr:aldo/keto reductase [Actinomycetota bacterium]